MTTDADATRAFLSERLKIFDPSIDTSAGSSADTEIITPMIGREGPDIFSSPIRDLFFRRLRSEFPSLVLQVGDPMDEGLLKPAQAIISPYRREIARVRNGQSLANPKTLTEAEANDLLANFFAERKTGGFATGVARAFFSAPRAFACTPTNKFFTGSGLNFFPVNNQAISAEAMLFQREGSRYFHDIVVRAEAEGDEYNIEPGSLVGVTGASEVVEVTNKRRFRDGKVKESTEEFIARVEGSFGERSLVSIRGIRATLGELFDTIQTIGVVGFNDPEMQRDIITGASEGVYAVGLLTSSSAQASVYLAPPGTNFSDEVGHRNFVDAGVLLGDKISYIDLSNGRFRDMTVVELISGYQLRLSPPPLDVGVVAPFLFRSKTRGKITISDIPGGILRPQTLDGEIVIDDHQVHIGGHMDVYIRAGSPQVQSIALEGVRDAEPLHFGVDLESFGARADEFVQVTDLISNRATTTAAFVGPGATTADILIQILDTGTDEIPWRPTINDVGRFVELLGSTDFSMHQIVAVVGTEIVGGRLCSRVRVTNFNQHTQSATVTVSNHAGTFNLSFRIVELVDVGRRVRDRGNPAVDFNGSGDGIGSQVGDSIVIENGDDAGVYTSRRILTSLSEDDMIILDRSLTATVTPSGAGDGTGLRYRVDNSLEVDLVEPRVVKIPLPPVFPGGDLSTVANSPIVSVTSGGTSNFVLAGIVEGDTLRISEGNDQRDFEITDVATGTLTLTSAVQSTASNLTFEVFRAFRGVELPLVRVRTVELLDSANQPTGTTVPYGDVIDARVLGALSNRAQGEAVESFTGEIVAASPLTIFEDTRVNFVARGVAAGWRLEIFEGPSANEYEIVETNVGSNPNRVRVAEVDDGGLEFIEVGSTLHYRIGLPSSGKARLYFLEPTSIEIDTGLGGARLIFGEFDERDIRFRFSEVSGRNVYPASGTELADFPRDLRVCRVEDLGAGQFESIVELTSTNTPDVFDSEILEGDVLDVYEQIPFKTAGGLTFEEASIFGTPAGLRTIAGSNRVSIPSNSRIDFTQMGDLGGQLLHINAGPDQGMYTIQRVLGTKTIELSSAMIASTVAILGIELSVTLDSQLIEDPPASGDIYLEDTTDSGQFGTAGDVFTIFESSDPVLEGSFESTTVDFTTNRALLDGAVEPAGAHSFAWVRTAAGTLGSLLEQPFTLYSSVPSTAEITQVAAKSTDKTPLSLGTIPSGAPPLVTMQTPVGLLSGAGVVRNDRLEILAGPNAGVYPIFSVAGNDLTVYTARPFSTAEVGARFRIWGGVHGSLRMLRVRGFEGSNGRLEASVAAPYVIRRPGQLRVSSTEMSENVEGGLYYVDVDVESLGPGDDRNLQNSARLTTAGGVRVDGYTYRVSNSSLTFSAYEQVSLVFDRRFLAVGNSDLPENRTEISGRNLQISYETSPTTRIVNDVLRGESRTVVADAIAKHFLPAYVFTEINYQGGSGASLVGQEISDFINSLSKLARLEVSDIEKFVQRRGATFIEHPIVLASVTHDLDRKLIVERSDNFLGGERVPYNGTGRITTYFAVLGEGLLVTQT